MQSSDGENLEWKQNVRLQLTIVLWIGLPFYLLFFCFFGWFILLKIIMKIIIDISLSSNLNFNYIHQATRSISKHNSNLHTYRTVLCEYFQSGKCVYSHMNPKHILQYYTHVHGTMLTYTTMFSLTLYSMLNRKKSFAFDLPRVKSILHLSHCSRARVIQFWTRNQVHKWSFVGAIVVVVYNIARNNSHHTAKLDKNTFNCTDEQTARVRRTKSNPCGILSIFKRGGLRSWINRLHYQWTNTVAMALNQSWMTVSQSVPLVFKHTQSVCSSMGLLFAI